MKTDLLIKLGKSHGLVA